MIAERFDEAFCVGKGSRDKPVQWNASEKAEEGPVEREVASDCVSRYAVSLPLFLGRLMSTESVMSLGCTIIAGCPLFRPRSLDVWKRALGGVSGMVTLGILSPTTPQWNTGTRKALRSEGGDVCDASGDHVDACLGGGVLYGYLSIERSVVIRLSSPRQRHAGHLKINWNVGRDPHFPDWSTVTIAKLPEKDLGPSDAWSVSPPYIGTGRHEGFCQSAPHLGDSISRAHACNKGIGDWSGATGLIQIPTSQSGDMPILYSISSDRSGRRVQEWSVLVQENTIVGRDGPTAANRPWIS
ncbi:hypothetical protein L210DRAFT_3631674 [Boletus edulis BED1]|uniref:Uncharacterized protein n=1 Tax=Boletus edulis BED1 TaxID=1328754 RepID=A0AAD4GDE9_BOLED|nr:hypothetical protein L210DRAFT_3631674 [Boletus edulis BED1]